MIMGVGKHKLEQAASYVCIYNKLSQIIILRANKVNKDEINLPDHIIHKNSHSKNKHLIRQDIMYILCIEQISIFNIFCRYILNLYCENHGITDKHERVVLPGYASKISFYNDLITQGIKV
jgi:hypothetical protein